MLGGTTKGFCRREWALWYGDKVDKSPCGLPLTDGKLCGDVYSGANAKRNTPDCATRCPYSRKELNVDFRKCKSTTYAKQHDGALVTGGAGKKAHDPEKNGLVRRCKP